ncbi:MAG TPA: CGNR zinc finger domain-containing protein [Micromonosporaceae bacterium]
MSVALVNSLTGGSERGRPYPAPATDDLASLAAASLPDRPDVSRRDAAYLLGAAQRMRAVIEAVDADRVDDAARVLNDLLAATGARPQLDRTGDEPWQLHFHGSDDSIAIGWSAGCAAALALAVGSDLAGRLGVCQATACDRVYVDISRNATRHFCSTACQSRTKAAAFRARRSG